MNTCSQVKFQEIPLLLSHRNIIRRYLLEYIFLKKKPTFFATPDLTRNDNIWSQPI
jgi:hypothetical protein